MYSKFKRPSDTPAAACGRCFWWKQNKTEGWGRCAIFREKRWYKCMVSPEYEFDQ